MFIDNKLIMWVSDIIANTRFIDQGWESKITDSQDRWNRKKKSNSKETQQDELYKAYFICPTGQI